MTQILLSSFQAADNPTTGYTIRKEETKQVNLITLCKSIGIEHVVVADPFDVKNFEKVVKEEVEREEPSVLDYQTRLAVSADIYRIIRKEGKTALLVTHDISEAISLSDRVVVLSHRPAVVKSIHRLTQLQGVPPLQRRDHPAFAGYFKSIWKELEVHER